MSLTILRKGLLLVSVPLVFQLTFIGLVIGLQRSNKQAQELSLHSNRVLTRTQAAIKALIDAEASSRGFVITGNPVFQEEYRQAKQDASAALDQLDALVVGNPAQQAVVKTVREKAVHFTAWHEEQQQAVLDGDAPAAVDRVKLLLGKRQMDALKEDFDSFLNEEERLREIRNQALAQSWTYYGYVIIGGSAAAVLVTLVLGWVFHRGIRSRLDRLVENARRLAHGDPLSPPIGGNDEISRVDRSFHQMADELAQSAQALRDQQQAIQRMNEELEDRVIRRTAELAEVNSDLRQKQQENEMFVYSVSHDLRSPLVNLQGFGRELTLSCKEMRALLDRDEVPADARQSALSLIDHDIDESVRYINTAVTRLSGIINALLGLSRAGRVEYRHQTVDVGAITACVVEAMDAVITQRSARVIIGELPEAWGDPTALEQVFANLIGNALNYLDPQRTGEIEIGAREDERSADFETAGEFTVYYVKDNGVGIRAAHQHKVFEAFQRLNAKLAEGEGMGLTMARRIVERHGGRIWVESTEGVGSTFFVLLPTSQATDVREQDEDLQLTQERKARDGDRVPDYSLGGRR